MTEIALKTAIRETIKSKYLGKNTLFKASDGEAEKFKVASYKIHSRKKIGIERYEYDDCGIDEDTQKFIVVEFWDAENQYDVMGCTSCIFTLNSKGQLGVCDGPFGFELTVAYDTAIEMVDEIMDTWKRICS